MLTKIKSEHVVFYTYPMNYLNNYKEDIDEEVRETTNEVTKEAKEELIRTSPKGNGHRATPYYKGWTVKVGTRGKSKYEKVIWNKTNYQLTHLLEFGHVKSNGRGWVNSSPAGGHIRPVEEKYGTKFVDLLERRIGGIE